jgi:hypothetical protein
MKLKSIRLLLLLAALILALAAGDEGDKRDKPRRAGFPPTGIGLDSAMKEALLALC